MSDIHFFSVERTMNPLRSSLVCALALASFGCHPDAVTNVPVTPTAGIHFVNAVPDTMQLDFRVVDMISNAGLFDADFRGFDMYYKGIASGSRLLSRAASLRSARSPRRDALIGRGGAAGGLAVRSCGRERTWASITRGRGVRRINSGAPGRAKVRR